MRTLIIPCAGKKQIGNIPIYLLKHPDGQLLVHKVIKGVPIDEDDGVVVVIPKEDDILYNASTLIKNGMDKTDICVLVLEKNTNDAAETVYQSIQKLKIEGEIIVKDVNCQCKLNRIEHCNFVSGLNIMSYENEILNLRGMSYITINEKNKILDIIEKRIKSDYICTGVYGFKNAHDFVYAFHRLKEDRENFGRIYISHIVSYLIGYKERVFHYVNTEEYEYWGDIKSWNNIQNKYAMYIIDLDELFYELNDSVITNETLQQLEQLSRYGVSFVGITSKGRKEKYEYIDLLKNYNINLLEIVYGCSSSKVKRLISDKDEIEDIFGGIN